MLPLNVQSLLLAVLVTSSPPFHKELTVNLSTENLGVTVALVGPGSTVEKKNRLREV